MKYRLLIASLIVSLGLSAQTPPQLKLNLWAQNLNRVTDIAHCGDSRLFVTLQAGVIRIITDSNQVAATPFLDIQSIVNDAGNEQGLLGMVFDPNYATNGFFYVHYTAGTGAGVSRVSRFSVNPLDSSLADPVSEQILYTWPQPYANHNGGDLDFGPDGMLYIGFGDGGSGGDPQGHAQNSADPLGNMLRIDVSDPDTTYTIPADNPFVTADPADTLHEIWASGLRNPYRFGFDRLTGDLWIGDVGQNAWEEVDFWPAGDNSGANFGWRCYEGNAPYNTTGCQSQSFYDGPVVVHENVGTGGAWCSCIGGRVYRGALWPHLYGYYFYTDYCGQEFRSLLPDGSGGWIDEQACTTANYGYTVIAENAEGELFTGNNDYDRVYKIVDKCPMDPPVITYDGTTLSSTAANSYAWYVNGGLVPGANGQTYVPVQSGIYYVVGTFTGGCALQSDTLFAAIVGVPEFALPQIGLSPNPAKDEVTIAWTNGIAVYDLRVIDAGGRLLYQQVVKGTNGTTQDLTTFAAGEYVVQLCDASGAVLATSRLTIAR